MSPEETHLTLAQAHREVARLRNALRSIRPYAEDIKAEMSWGPIAFRADLICKAVDHAVGDYYKGPRDATD